MLRKNSVKTLLITSSLLAISFTTVSSYAWDLQPLPNDETSDVKVWTQALEGSQFKAFKAEVTINAPLDRIVSVIRDTENVPKWYYRSKLAKKIKRLNDHQSLNYSITDLPWPVSDRDSVILATVTTQPDGSVLIKMTGQPNAYPPQENLVRVPKLDGFWKLMPNSVDTAPPSVRVTLQISTEPGGDIPSWLANAMVIDMPFNSLNNLKMQVESLSH